LAERTHITISGVIVHIGRIIRHLLQAKKSFRL
jgi:hypothetical protein